ncbi:MAG: Rrf2 family transcriptional regulator [Actinomycetales bacterium]|nr:Rrf2 family transcriptional regulator [Actinomycetales bacterium]
MNVSAKADYGMRAMLELVACYEQNPTAVVKGDAIARAQQVPVKFLEAILRQLRLAGLVAATRGPDGGYRLDRPPTEITVADVIRALDGPLAAVRGSRPEDLAYNGSAEHLREVWVAARAAIRDVLEHVTLAEIAHGTLPAAVENLLAEPGAWQRR